MPMLKLDKKLFADVSAKAVASSRRRMHYDLRTQAFEPISVDGICSWQDSSMKMLNVMMKDSIIPIHRHNETNEVIILLEGTGEEVVYAVDQESGNMVETSRVRLTMEQCKGVVVGRGEWHTFIPLEDNTVIFEAKDGMYDPSKTEDIWIG